MQVGLDDHPVFPVDWRHSVPPVDGSPTYRVVPILSHSPEGLDEADGLPRLRRWT